MLLQSPSPQNFDPELGFSYRPHAELFWGYEGFARTRFNSLGLNSPEVGPRIRPWRILIIGDSYSEGRHVALSDHFLSIAMNAEPRLEVINAGRDGLNVATFPVMQRKIAAAVHPDLTVVVLSAGRLEDLNDSKVETYRLPNGEITSIKYKLESQDVIKKTIAPLLRNSALLSALAYRFKGPTMAMLNDLADLPYRLIRESKFRQEKKITAVPAANTEPAISAASAKLAFVLRQMQANGAIAVLYMPTLTYEPRQQANISRHSRERELVMQQVANSIGIPFITATPEFLAEQSLTGQPLHGFANAAISGGHLNSRGHRALGLALARVAETILAKN